MHESFNTFALQSQYVQLKPTETSLPSKTFTGDDDLLGEVLGCIKPPVNGAIMDKYRLTQLEGDHIHKPVFMKCLSL